MTIEETLTWPFFDEKHRAFAAALARWADATLPALPHGEHSDAVDAACRSRVKALGEAGRLVPGTTIPPPTGAFPRYVEPGTESDEPKAKKPNPQKKT